MSRSRSGPLRKIALAFLAMLLMTALVEGLCTLAFLTWDLSTKDTEDVAERRHTLHDDELGWIAAPNVNLRDFYGPGLHLRTNASGFRNETPVEPVIPQGKTRIICAGDSFTLGYGVANDDTWTAKLQVANDGFEVVNMGQGGYGLGQAWLWYRRERERLAHDVLVFGFIGHDFERLRMPRMFGYPKPLLRVRSGKVRVTGTPLPRRAAATPWLNRKTPSLERLATWRLLKNMGNIVRGDGDDGLTPEGEAREIVREIFEDLRTFHEARETKVVLVWFPSRQECTNGGVVPWRAFVTEEAERQKMEFLDLSPMFRDLPMRRLDGLFISSRDVTFPGASGHYTPRGNAIVARELRSRLEAMGVQ